MHFSINTLLARRITLEGVSVRANTVSVRYLPEQGYRFSVVVSKKLGGAVERNHVKRALREFMRVHEGKFPHGLYLVYYNQECSRFRRSEAENDLRELITGRLSQFKTIPENND